MNYVKSVFAGFVAVLLVCGILPLLAALFILLLFALTSLGLGLGIGVDFPRWHVPSLVEWLLVFAVFGIGFSWEFRRLAKQKLPPTPDPTNLPVS